MWTNITTTYPFLLKSCINFTSPFALEKMISGNFFVSSLVISATVINVLGIFI